MANHKHAKKMIRKIKRRTTINTNRHSLIKTSVKKAEVALGIRGQNAQPLEAKEIKKRIVEAESKLMRGAQKGILKKKTASRKVSRLIKHLKKVAS